MRKRSKVSRHSDRNRFTRSAMKTNKKNIRRKPMRGGIRL